MQNQHEIDETFMNVALKLARQAAAMGEVPVGAVIVCGGNVVGQGFNLRESRADPLAHAEIIAIAEAAHALKRWRLSGCTLYATLEPCPMCAGAIVNARIDRLVFGATDKRAGAAGTVFNIAADERLNHRAAVQGGLLGEQAARLLQEFFAARRRKGQP